jgi:TPR repeat protein
MADTLATLSVEKCSIRWITITVAFALAACLPAGDGILAAKKNPPTNGDPYHAATYYYQAMDAANPKIRATAIKNLLMAAYTKNPTAMYYLGRYYLLTCGSYQHHSTPLGWRIKYNLKRCRYAVRWLKDAGLLGCRRADIILGTVVFYHGIAVGRPRKGAAQKWLGRAMRAGDPEAYYATGMHLMATNPRRGNHYLLTAARMGNVWARLWMISSDTKLRLTVWNAWDAGKEPTYLADAGPVGKFLAYSFGSRSYYSFARAREFSVTMAENGRACRLARACLGNNILASYIHRYAANVRFLGAAGPKLVAGLLLIRVDGDRKDGLWLLQFAGDRRAKAFYQQYKDGIHVPFRYYVPTLIP